MPEEKDAQKGREKIDWKPLTDLPVRSRRDATEKLDWYAQRRKVETFHKILKSGCCAEEAKLRTGERLGNLIAILSILSWMSRVHGQTLGGVLLVGDPGHFGKRGMKRDSSAVVLR
jgi:hypothetical protein